MRRTTRTRVGLALFALAFLAGLLLAGCDRTSAPEPQPHTLTRAAVSAVDGMILLDYPGPKGQLVPGEGEPLYYCDTLGLLNALRTPDGATPGGVPYVQAFDGRAWGSYDDGWVKADEAVYVMGSDRMGAMGPTFVSFREQAAAEAFMAEHGGQLLAYEDVTADVLEAHAERVRERFRAQGAGMAGHTGMAHGARGGGMSGMAGHGGVGGGAMAAGQHGEGSDRH